MKPRELATATVSERYHVMRRAQPVRIGVPFRQGLIHDADQLSVRTEDGPAPTQARALGRWSDGSIRWALLDFQADLDLRRATELKILAGSPQADSGSAGAVACAKRDGLLVVDSGPLTVSVPMTGRPVLHATWTGQGVDEQIECELSIQIREAERGELNVEILSADIIGAGPLVAELKVVMSCLDRADHLMDICLYLSFFASKSFFHAAVSVQGRETDVELSMLQVQVAPMGISSTAQCCYSELKGSQTGEAELFYTFEVDAGNDPVWYEDSPEPSWVLWECARGGIMATIRNADHHFPKRMAASAGAVELDLHPLQAKPFHMYPWMGKTTEFMLEWVPPGVQGHELTFDSALFHRPLRPACAPEYYQETGVFGDIFPTSQKYGVFEGLIATALRERTVGIGAMHYGDDPNWGYGYAGRGHQETVWTNGEYDTAHMFILQYARTGHRHYFESAEAAAFHSMDIDFMRSSPNPRWAGGLCCHEGDHRVVAYAGPSHEWLEGLLDYYFLTGYPPALETALSIGDNICRYIEDGVFDEPGTYHMRELGWALTAIAGAYKATLDRRFRDTGMRVVRILEHWQAQFGGFADVAWYSGPKPGTERRPLRVKRDAFISLTLNGLERFYRATGESEARDLFVGEALSQLEWCMSAEGWAEQRETKIPNLETFAYGYEYTGNPDFIATGLRVLRLVLSNCFLRYYNNRRSVKDEEHSRPALYRLQKVDAIGNQILGLAFAPLLPFMQLAEEQGCLESWLG